MKADSWCRRFNLPVHSSSLRFTFVRRDEDANGLLDMADPPSFRQDIVCAEHRLIDGFPHYQPVELCRGDHRVAERQQDAIRPPLYVDCQTPDRPARAAIVNLSPHLPETTCLPNHPP